MFNDKLFMIISLFLVCSGSGDSKISHLEAKEKRYDNKILQNNEIISDSRSHNRHRSLQISRRDKSNKITFG